jgi:type II secretory pathway component PulK
MNPASTISALTRHGTTGSALLLVLWAILVMSMAMVGWVAWIQGDVERAADSNRAVEARAMACSGLAIGLHPLVSERTPGLEESLDEHTGFRVRITGEGGRLNINWLLDGEDPRRLSILKLWLEQHGLDFQQRERLVDSLLDFIDGDDIKRLNGAEAGPDYQPLNRPFQSLDEVELVANIEPLVRSPGWKEQLTIDSLGPIDLSSADEAILRLIPGLSESRIARFLQLRRGRDGLDGTIDDFQFKNLKEIQSSLGFSDAAFKELGGLIVAKDQTQRIISEGWSGNVIRQITVIARKSGANPTIVHWEE